MFKKQTKKLFLTLFSKGYKILIIPLIKKLNHSKLPQIYNDEKQFWCFPRNIWKANWKGQSV